MNNQQLTKRVNDEELIMKITETVVAALNISKPFADCPNLLYTEKFSTLLSPMPELYREIQ